MLFKNSVHVLFLALSATKYFKISVQFSKTVDSLQRSNNCVAQSEYLTFPNLVVTSNHQLFLPLHSKEYRMTPHILS